LTRRLSATNGGTHGRMCRTEQNGVPQVVKEDKSASPTFVLPPGAYVVNVAFGLASATKAFSLRAETLKDVIEIPAGGCASRAGWGTRASHMARFHLSSIKAVSSSPGTDDRSRRGS
jgi:hypothetical protein